MERQDYIDMIQSLNSMLDGQVAMLESMRKKREADMQRIAVLTEQLAELTAQITELTQQIAKVKKPAKTHRSDSLPCRKKAQLAPVGKVLEPVKCDTDPKVELETIRTFADVDNLITKYGFLPLGETRLIKEFSIFENLDDPLQFSDILLWRAELVHSTCCAYGTFFYGKNGFVSAEMLPHFLNFRRTKVLKRNPDEKVMDETLLEMIKSNPSITEEGLKASLGLDHHLTKNLARLMMEGQVVLSDCDYGFYKNGKKYCIDRYSTPEWLYGSDIVATCPPHESYTIMSAHITPLLKDLPEAKIKKLLGYIRKHI